MNKQKPEDVMPEGAVVEALELRAPHDAVCRHALALLREKDATIDALNGLFVKATSDAEQERFQCKNICKPTYKNLLETARAEAITEFEERLIKYYDALKSGLVAYHIKEVAKELKEDLNAT